MKRQFSLFKVTFSLLEVNFWLIFPIGSEWQFSRSLFLLVFTGAIFL